MKCPICGKPSSDVIETRTRTDGIVRRRRACFDGHHYTTYEASQDRMEELLAYEKFYHKMQDVIDNYGYQNN